MKNAINIIIIIGLVIISGFTGYSVGNKYINLNNYVGKADYMNLSNKINILEKKYKFALEDLNRYKKAYNILIPKTPNEVFIIDGIVEKVGSGQIIIKTPDLKNTTLVGEKQVFETKNIKLDKNTIITKVNPLNIIQDINGKEKNNILDISFIKLGDQITVSSNENIKSKKEFVARKISIIEEIKMPEFTIPTNMK